jgi:uncharacterized phage protein (TIGR01671 family)
MVQINKNDMNREIKFRCYDTYLKQMVPHVHGFHFMGEVMAFGVLEAYIFENMGDRVGSLSRWPDIEVMQFTGLLDKNKNEIYEGDIVLIAADNFAEAHGVKPGHKIVFGNHCIGEDSWQIQHKTPGFVVKFNESSETYSKTLS